MEASAALLLALSETLRAEGPGWSAAVAFNRAGQLHPRAFTFLTFNLKSCG